MRGEEEGEKNCAVSVITPQYSFLMSQVKKGNTYLFRRTHILFFFKLVKSSE